MAFKIQSIEKMKNVATKMGDCSVEAQRTTSNVLTNIEVMVNSISGRGVDESLERLRDAVTADSRKMTELLDDISTFISTQTTSYAANEETVAGELNGVGDLLEGITI